MYMCVSKVCPRHAGYHETMSTCTILQSFNVWDTHVLWGGIICTQYIHYLVTLHFQTRLWFINHLPGSSFHPPQLCFPSFHSTGYQYLLHIPLLIFPPPYPFLSQASSSHSSTTHISQKHSASYPLIIHSSTHPLPHAYGSQSAQWPSREKK